MIDETQAPTEDLGFDPGLLMTMEEMEQRPTLGVSSEYEEARGVLETAGAIGDQVLEGVVHGAGKFVYDTARPTVGIMNKAYELEAKYLGGQRTDEDMLTNKNLLELLGTDFEDNEQVANSYWDLVAKGNIQDRDNIAGWTRFTGDVVPLVITARGVTSRLQSFNSFKGLVNSGSKLKSISSIVGANVVGDLVSSTLHYNGDETSFFQVIPKDDRVGVIDWLADRNDDEWLMNMVKNTTEGAILGSPFEFITTLKLLKQAKAGVAADIGADQATAIGKILNDPEAEDAYRAATSRPTVVSPKSRFRLKTKKNTAGRQAGPRKKLSKAQQTRLNERNRQAALSKAEMASDSVIPPSRTYDEDLASAVAEKEYKTTGKILTDSVDVQEAISKKVGHLPDVDKTLNLLDDAAEQAVKVGDRVGDQVDDILRHMNKASETVTGINTIKERIALTAAELAKTTKGTQKYRKLANDIRKMEMQVTSRISMANAQGDSLFTRYKNQYKLLQDMGGDTLENLSEKDRTKLSKLIKQISTDPERFAEVDEAIRRGKFDETIEYLSALEGRHKTAAISLMEDFFNKKIKNPKKINTITNFSRIQLQESIQKSFSLRRILATQHDHYKDLKQVQKDTDIAEILASGNLNDAEVLRKMGEIAGLQDTLSVYQQRMNQMINSSLMNIGAFAESLEAKGAEAITNADRLKFMSMFSGFNEIVAADAGVGTTLGRAFRQRGMTIGQNNKSVHNAVYKELVDLAAHGETDGKIFKTLTEVISGGGDISKSGIDDTIVKAMQGTMDKLDSAASRAEVDGVINALSGLAKKGKLSSDAVTKLTEPLLLSDYFRAHMYLGHLSGIGTVGGSIMLGGAIKGLFQNIIQPAFDGMHTLATTGSASKALRHSMTNPLIGLKSSMQVTTRTLSYMFRREGTEFKALGDYLGHLYGLGNQGRTDRASTVTVHNWKEATAAINKTMAYYDEKGYVAKRNITYLMRGIIKPITIGSTVLSDIIDHSDKWNRAMASEVAGRQAVNRRMILEGGSKADGEKMFQDLTIYRRKYEDITQSVQADTLVDELIVDLGLEGTNVKQAEDYIKTLAGLYEHTKRMADSSVFQSSLDDTHAEAWFGLHSKIQAASNNTATAKVASAVVLPFYKTPVNLLQESLEVSPVAGVLTRRMQFDLGIRTKEGLDFSNMKKASAAEPERQAAAISKIFASTALGAVMYTLFQQNRITGAQPTGGRDSDQLGGFQPNSVKVGNTYYNFDKFGHVGLAMGLLADVFTNFKESSDAEDQVKRISLLVMAQTLNPEYLRGLKELLEVAQGDIDGEKYMAKRFGSIITPARGANKTVIKSIEMFLLDNKEYTPEEQEAMYSLGADITGFMDKAGKDDLLWRAGTLLDGKSNYTTKLDPLGEPISHSGNDYSDRLIELLGASNNTDVKTADPVNRALLLAGINPLKNSAQYRNAKFNKAELEEYRKAFGEGGVYKEHLRKQIESPEWKLLSQEEQHEFLNKFTTYWRNEAKANVYANSKRLQNSTKAVKAWTAGSYTVLGDQTTSEFKISDMRAKTRSSEIKAIQKQLDIKSNVE